MQSVFDSGTEISKRIDFLANYLISSGMSTFVLGISGGVDSLLAGMLAQRAVMQLREVGREAQFIAVRLPYGLQADENEAQRAVSTIAPDRTSLFFSSPLIDRFYDRLAVAIGTARTGPKIERPTSRASSIARQTPSRCGFCALSHCCRCSFEQKKTIAGQQEAAALPL